MTAKYYLQNEDSEFVLRVRSDGGLIFGSSSNHAAKFSATIAKGIIKDAEAHGMELTRIPCEDRSKGSERILPMLKSWGFSSKREESDDRRVNRELRSATPAQWEEFAGALFAELSTRMGREFEDLGGYLWGAIGGTLLRDLPSHETPAEKIRFILMRFRNNATWKAELFCRFMNSRIDMGIVGTKDSYGEDARRQAQDPTDDRPTGKEFAENGISVDEKVKSSGSDSQNVSVADRIADRYAEDPLVTLLRKGQQESQWGTFEFLLSLPDPAPVFDDKGSEVWQVRNSDLFAIVGFLLTDDKKVPSLSGAMKAVGMTWNLSREKKVRASLQSIFIRAFGEEEDLLFADPRNPKAPFAASGSLNHTGFRVTSTWKAGAPEFMKAGK